jgi:hypothetical protein
MSLTPRRPASALLTKFERVTQLASWVKNTSRAAFAVSGSVGFMAESEVMRS